MIAKPGKVGTCPSNYWKDRFPGPLAWSDNAQSVVI